MQLEGVREEIHRLPKPSKDKKPPFKNIPEHLLPWYASRVVVNSRPEDLHVNVYHGKVRQEETVVQQMSMSVVATSFHLHVGSHSVSVQWKKIS
jgi:hypothetical protein